MALRKIWTKLTGAAMLSATALGQAAADTDTAILITDIEPALREAGINPDRRTGTRAQPWVFVPCSLANFTAEGLDLQRPITTPFLEDDCSFSSGGGAYDLVSQIRFINDNTIAAVSYSTTDGDYSRMDRAMMGGMVRWTFSLFAAARDVRIGPMRALPDADGQVALFTLPVNNMPIVSGVAEPSHIRYSGDASCAILIQNITDPGERKPQHQLSYWECTLDSDVMPDMAVLDALPDRVSLLPRPVELSLR